MRIGAAHPMGVGAVDMDRNPLPSFRRLHLGGDPFQLVDDEPIQQHGILAEAAPVLGDQVADDVASRLHL